MNMLAPVALLALSLTACNGASPASTTNTMTSAGSTETATGAIVTPPATPSPATMSPSATASSPATSAAPAARDYAGRWTGVEGTYLNVTATGPGTASLEMQYDLDNKGTYPATVTRDGLRFVRNGATLVARPSDGDATGLKWLAGKKHCLTVGTGEGYCRA